MNSKVSITILTWTDGRTWIDNEKLKRTKETNVEE